jgi:hypothetical protein
MKGNEAFEDYLADHLARHSSRINRVSAIAGDLIIVGSVLAGAVTRRPKVAAWGSLLGSAVFVSGHIVEGNLPSELEQFRRHPIWAARGDAQMLKLMLKRSSQPAA